MWKRLCFGIVGLCYAVLCCVNDVDHRTYSIPIIFSICTTKMTVVCSVL